MRTLERKNITADAKSAEMRSGRKWEEIFSHSEIYPESFLKALERNPEILKSWILFQIIRYRNLKAGEEFLLKSV